MFCSKSSLVSGLTFRSLINFEFIFVCGVRKCSNFILLHVAVQLSQHHLLDGHEFKQTLGVSDGQGGLACFSPWGRKELDTTERLN